MRKATDDAMARTVAENRIGDLFSSNGHSVGDRADDVSAAAAGGHHRAVGGRPERRLGRVVERSPGRAH
jgi:hypothetical protein